MSPESMLYIRALLAFCMVAGLIFLLGAGVKKSGFNKRLLGYKGAVPRLAVIETLYLDPKRRLVIVRADKKEHLLLLSTAGDKLIHSCEEKEPYVAP